MDREELLEVFRSIDAEPSRFADQLADACRRTLGVGSCGFSLILEGRHRGPLGASSPLALRGESLQHDLSEGPAIDAARTREQIAEPRLDAGDVHRWPAFSPAAAAAGLRAVFAVPLAVGGATLGALTVYEGRRGDLTIDQAHDLRALGEIVGQLVLVVQAGADPGSIAEALAEVGTYHPEVHQATGMVAARMGVPVAEAMVRLRARAYADGLPLATLSREVVARRVHLDRP